MFTLLLRFLPVLIGSVWLLLAWSSWDSDMPPTWTLFMPRDSAVVRESGIAVEPLGNGTMRYLSVVIVEWPTGSSRTYELGDLQDVVSVGKREDADLALANFPVGATIAVKAFNNAPFADRTDWLRFGQALLLTVLGLPLFGFGLFLVITLRKR